MLDINEIRIFIAVAKSLSFTKASKEVGLSSPQITKIVAQLEFKLKRKLLLRTTRKVQLTQEGQVFYVECLNFIESYHKLSDTFNESTNPKKVKGLLRISTAHTLAIRGVSEILSSFHKKFPLVNVQLIISDDYIDLIQSNIDFAFRITDLKDSSYIAKKIGDNPIIFCATPEYLKTFSAPKTIQDLKKHAILSIEPHSKKYFRNAKVQLKEIAQPSWIQTSNGDVLVKLALQNGGILVRSAWGVKDELKSGQFVQVLLDDELISDTDVYLVYPMNNYRTTVQKLFIEHALQSNLS